MRTERPMQSRIKATIALFSGTTMLAIAFALGFGVGGGQLLSSTTPTETPGPASTSVVVAPALSPQADAPNGCIHGANCGPATPKPHP